MNKKLLDVISGDPTDFVEYVKPIKGTLFVGKTIDGYHSIFIQLNDECCVCTREGLYLSQDDLEEDLGNVLELTTISCRDVLNDDDAKPVKTFDIPECLNNDILCIVINELLRQNGCNLYITTED